MESTPKSLRLQIALMGRTNVGKSSVMNLIAGQDVALISEHAGTTTDIVEKAIELLPLGPVTILDTAGIDDISTLSKLRIDRSMKIMDRAEIIVLVCEPNVWTEYEENLVKEAESRKISLIIIVNKIDLSAPNPEFLELISTKVKYFSVCSNLIPESRDKYIDDIKSSLMASAPDRINEIPLVGDLVPPGGLCIMIVPIDLQAPKGRLILPQIQAIRDILDNDAATIVVKEREYSFILDNLKNKPDLVICDSQVVMKMVADTPPDVKCTTFSILFSRYKGDLIEEVKGAATIDKLKPGYKILIAESCSHHSLQDDIGSVKIPRWLRSYLGTDIQIDYSKGRDYPDNLKEYSLVIHCGGCMLTRNEKLVRIQKAKNAGVPITNYGLTISKVQGVLERALSPFPGALEALRNS